MYETEKLRKQRKEEPLTTIKSILFYRAKGLTTEEIAYRCKCSRLTVMKYLKIQKNKDDDDFKIYFNNLFSNKKLKIL